MEKFQDPILKIYSSVLTDFFLNVKQSALMQCDPLLSHTHMSAESLISWFMDVTNLQSPNNKQKELIADNRQAPSIFNGGTIFLSCAMILSLSIRYGGNLLMSSSGLKSKSQFISQQWIWDLYCILLRKVICCSFHPYLITNIFLFFLG